VSQILIVIHAFVVQRQSQVEHHRGLWKFIHHSVGFNSSDVQIMNLPAIRDRGTAGDTAELLLFATVSQFA